MLSCDVLIVGAGPAGSSCAWALRDSGLDVAILDKQLFPRDKVCGGWITPGALTALGVDAAEYGSTRILQRITGFRTGYIGGDTYLTDYHRPVSYGIRRREFDDFLLQRCQARVYQGVNLESLERADGSWIVNGDFGARVLVGAGGHFCPVARQLMGRSSGSTAVVAQEAEFEMNEQQRASCRVSGTTPELYFCTDMKGYAWCLRKGDILNVGLGRADSRHLPEHVQAFLRFLRAARGVCLDDAAFHGHAYRLYGKSARRPSGDGFLLAGDSAGLARPFSGEGILPAIQSGLLAAETIRAARGNYGEMQMASYTRRVAQQFGDSRVDWAMSVTGKLPPVLIRFAAAHIVNSRWLVRHLVLDRWFLGNCAQGISATRS